MLCLYKWQRSRSFSNSLAVSHTAPCNPVRWPWESGGLNIHVGCLSSIPACSSLQWLARTCFVPCLCCSSLWSYANIWPGIQFSDFFVWWTFWGNTALKIMPGIKWGPKQWNRGYGCRNSLWWFQSYFIQAYKYFLRAKHLMNNYYYWPQPPMSECTGIMTVF